MENIKKWFYEKTASTSILNLEKNGFKAIYFEKIDTAVSYITEIIAKYDTIGFGGSVTVLYDLKLHDIAKKLNKNILNHNAPDITAEKKHQIRLSQQTCDLFITSTNALTKDGKLVNIDGAGNRVSAMIFGPKKVLVVAGINKIVKDVDKALKRIKEISAPMNTKRLSLKTPCAATGECADCSSSDRICRVTTIIEKKPNYTDIEIVIIGENLGF
jgi:L-lactate utilization protein LutB